MANQIRHANGPLPQAANTTLTASIGASGSSSPTVASAANLPTSGPFLIVVDNERIEVDSISGTTLTILSGGRAQEGTSAASHSSGANVYQVLSSANLVRTVEDRTGTVLAPDPTGTAATDKSNLDALTGTANRTIQLRPGTYVVNPLADFANGVVLRGYPNHQTTLKLAVQANFEMLDLGIGGGLEDLILDGDRANQTFATQQYEGLVTLAPQATIRNCRFQNGKSSFLVGLGQVQIENPDLYSVTTSTSGGSLATGVQHWYRVTATTAGGESAPSQEKTVTTGAGSTNSNTLRWRLITGATGYKVYHATTLANRWTEQLLATIGSGSTLVYVHTTGSGATTPVPMNNTTGTNVNDVEVANCTFTNTAAVCVYGEQNCNNWNVHDNRASLMTRNFFYVAGSTLPNFGLSNDLTVADNWIDYSDVLPVAGQFVCGIELWNRVRRCHIRGNHIIGPRDDTSADSAKNFIGISLGGDNDFTTVEGNVIQKANLNGSDTAILYGIENAASSHVSVVNNTVFGADYGMTCGGADFNAGGSDNVTITGNVFRQMNRFGIEVTEGGGQTIQGNTFIDAGYHYIHINGFQKQTLACSIVGNIGMITSNDRSSDSNAGGKVTFIKVNNAGRHTITGNVCGPMQPISTPAAPTVTPQGTTGATTYTYKITGVNEYGETVGSANGTTTTGNATLSVSNFNRLTWTQVPSTVIYRIYRTVGGGSAGYIGYTGGFVEQFDDTGIAADTNLTAPATGTSAGTSTVGLTGIWFQGTSLVESSVISGNRFDGSPPVGATLPSYAMIFDGQVDYTQVTNNFAANYATAFIQQTGTPAANPNFIQNNLAPGIPLPHMEGAKFHDVVRRADEMQRFGGGMWLADDFTGGLTSTGNIGDLGWQFNAAVGTGAIAQQAAVASHAGIVRMNTSATTNSRLYFWVGSSATVGQILPADWFSMIIMFRFNQAPDTATIWRMGLGNSANADPPNDGIYIEKLLTDSTQLFGLNRASSTSSTRTTALATISNGAWMKAVIRRATASTIGFSVSTTFNPDNGTEATVSTNIPTAALVPFFMVGNNTTVDKTVDIDYVEINVNNMSR